MRVLRAVQSCCVLGVDCILHIHMRLATAIIVVRFLIIFDFTDEVYILSINFMVVVFFIGML